MAGTNTLSGRPRLLILNQYFGSREATGQLLAELTADLSAEFDIAVVAAQLGDADAHNDPTPDCVRVRRVPSANFSRSSLWLRALNYLSFLVRLPAAALRLGRPSVVLSLTDPPVVGLAALVVATLRHAPFVLVCQDVHPQLGQQSGKLTSRPIVFVLRAIQRVLLRHATRVVAIGEQMRRMLIDLGAREDSVDVIANWADTSRFQPHPRANRWALEHDLIDRFVLMHAGNVGQLQGLEVLVDAVADVPGVTLVIVGDGSGQGEVARRAVGRDDVVLLPWENRDRMAEVHGAADVLVVSLLPGLAGLLEPSKLYGILAAGRPVLAVLDAQSEGARVVTEQACGTLARAGDRQEIASAIGALVAASDNERALMGGRGRAYAELEADRRHAAAKYAHVLGRAISQYQTGRSRSTRSRSCR